MNKIKFVFFDLGNVLLHFDHSRMIGQVASLSGLDAAEVERLLLNPPFDLENRFERGELDGVEFHRDFCQIAKCQVSKDELMRALADIFWLNTSIAPLVAQLRAINFPMAILSNTCQAHWEFARDKFTLIGELFSRRILSYEEKCMKPSGKIYQAAISMALSVASCEPGEIFFADDKQENVDAAIAAGINAELFESSAKLFDSLRAGGVF